MNGCPGLLVKTAILQQSRGQVIRDRARSARRNRSSWVSLTLADREPRYIALIISPYILVDGESRLQPTLWATSPFPAPASVSRKVALPPLLVCREMQGEAPNKWSIACCSLGPGTETREAQASNAAQEGLAQHKREGSPWQV